jgi:DNA-binding MarR family transcriptional regulator
VAILDDFRRIVQLLRESSRTVERLGVTVAQFFVLRSLAEAPALSLTALAARTRAHQSTVSVVVKRLVSAGLVQRRASANDGRCLQLQLTKRGARLLERAPLAPQDRLIHGIEHLPPAKRRQLAHTLHELVLELHLDDELPVMFFEAEGAPDTGNANGAPKTKRIRREPS